MSRIQFSYEDRTRTVEDEHGVIFSGDGGIILGVDKKKFKARTYTVPIRTHIIWQWAFSGLETLEEIRFETVEGTGTLEYLGEFAFECCPNLRKVHLPDSVRLMGQCVFSGCRRLEEVHLPENLRSIPCECFDGCESLERINIPGRLECFEICCFRGCGKLSDVRWPSTLRWMEDTAFYGTALEDVVLPEGLEFIGEDMFRDCPGLRRLVIPSTVKRIIPWTVSDSPVFEGIACHSPLFRVEGEALIRNADDAMLCCWTRSERYAVPSGVRRLDGFGSGSVRILTCDHPLEGIGHDCFGGCESLKEVSLQAVGEIADSAFFGLTDVKVTVDGKPYPIPRDDEGIAMLPYFPYQG